MSKMKRTKTMTRARAIKVNCLECAGDSSQEVLLCHIETCPLWPYRATNHEKRLRAYLETHPDIAKERKAVAEES
jgi:hypothetical protein